MLKCTRQLVVWRRVCEVGLKLSSQCPSFRTTTIENNYSSTYFHKREFTLPNNQLTRMSGCDSKSENGDGESQSHRIVPRHFNTLPNEEIVSFLNNIDAVMFDCDGVLWHGEKPLQNAQNLVITLRKMGKKVFFMTNNSTKTREEFLLKFEKLGFEATLDEIVNTSYLAALYLAERNYNKKVYVIGTTGVTRELEKQGIEFLPIGPDPMDPSQDMWTHEAMKARMTSLDPDVGAVIVGFDQHISYMKLFRAASYLKNKDCHFIATNTDEGFPTGNNMILPGTGAMVSAVKTAAGREPIVMGKPYAYPFEFVKRFHNLIPSRVLMIGDRANTDINFGRNCGLWTLLVFSGVTQLEEVEQWKKSSKVEEQLLLPHYYLQEVDDLYQIVQTVKNHVGAEIEH